MNPSSHCRASIFVGKFKFQYISGDIHIHIATKKHHFDIISSKVALCVAVQIWKSPLTFRKEILFELLACIHCECIGTFKDEICTIGYISQLNWNWRAHNRAGFFNGFELYLKLGSKSFFSYSACIEINLRFRGRNFLESHC